MRNLKKLIKDLCSWFRKGSHIIVYGGSLDLFIDNAKHLFIYQNEQMPEYEHIWITKNRDVLQRLHNIGLKAYHPFSIAGIWKQLRAEFEINDINTQYSKGIFFLGAYRIELWHGIPNKKIMYARKNPSNPEDIFLADTQEKKDLYKKYRLLNTSKNLANVLSFAFQIPIENMLWQNYPRNRVLVMNEDEREMFIEKYETSEFKETYYKIKNINARKIAYLPTFRDGNPSFMGEAIPDFNSLNETCKAHNVMLFIKPHRVALMPDISGLSNVVLVSNMIDIYPILPLFDLLISDYSGIMFDYPLTGNKIVLYPYDQQQYKDNSRDLYPHYYKIQESLTCVYNFHDFLEILYMNESNIKDFPISDYIDDIHEFNAVSCFIKSVKR